MDGKQLIKVYPKQGQMIKTMCDTQRCITLACRQCGKSTAYTVFALWYVLGNIDKSVLICANKFKTAKDILQRIKMAYEQLPLWLKPGIVQWNAASIKFDNGCKISAQATSGSSGRGGSINVLICDQFAFLKPSLQSQFLQSVFPVVSSSKTSKIILVSTPNGMGNQFYRTWNRAQLKLNQDQKNKNLNWQMVKIDWWQVPGRDERWKKLQLESFNNDQSKFLQEYGNSFLGSAETLIDANKIKQIKQNFIKFGIQPHQIQLHKDFQKTKIKMYKPPMINHAYIIGADPSMGTESDYHSMIVYDITNTFNIQQVAGFYQNDVPPKMFAYMLTKVGFLYNKAYIAIENNGCSQVVLDALWRDFDYDNIVHEGGNVKTSIGIHSSSQLKTLACIYFKQLIQDPLRKIYFNDGRLIAQLQKFERRQRPGKIPTYEAADGHDDYMMAAIWGLYSLKMQIIENYYQVKKSSYNKLGQQIPLYLLPFEQNDSQQIKQLLSQIDNSFLKFQKSYKQIDNVSSQISIDEFAQQNDLQIVNNEDKYTKQQIVQDPDDDDFHFKLLF